MKIISKHLPYYKRNLTLALPIVLSQLGQIIVQQADIMMVGNIGATELAAISFAGSIFIFGMLFVMGFSLGLTTAVGHISDKSQHRLLGKLLSNAYLVNIIVTVLIALLLYVISFFFDQMGQDAKVVVLSKPYFYTLLLSLLPLSFFLINKQFAEGLGDTKNAMYLTLAANVLNIILNYVFIFGKYGFPKLGALGAGIATLISRIAPAIGFYFIFKRIKIFKSITHFVNLFDFDSKNLRELFSLGFPISMQMILEVTSFALSGVMAGWLGIVALASNQIALGLATMTFMLAAGVGSATTIRVSHYFGNKDWKNLIVAANASTHIVLVFMGISGLLLFIFRNYLPTFYTNDVKVIELSAMLLVIAAIFQLFDGLQVVMISILRGLGDVTHATWYSLISYIIISLPISYLLAFTFEFGAVGLWVGLIVGLASAGLLFYSRIRTLYKSFDL